MHNNDEYICRICGFINEEITWDQGIYPTYNICECCGVEFGYEDCSLDSIYKYRENWILEMGGRRNYNLEKLSDDLKKQLENIPEKYK